VLAAIGFAAPARAELVFFANGQSISVKGHRADSDRLVLLLRSGGELSCEAAIVLRIDPDEVPYPEPGAASQAAPSTNASVDQSPNTALERFAPIIDKIAGEQGVSPKLVRAVIRVESGGQPQARSIKGAVGLMQLMPETARLYTSNDPADPLTNLEAGTKHLRMLLDRFPLAVALAAYNAGETAVQRFGGIPPYPETQRYVSAVLQLLAR